MTGSPLDPSAGERAHKVRAEIMTAIAQRDPLVPLIPLIVVTSEAGTGKTALGRTIVDGAPGVSSLIVASSGLTFHDLLKKLITDWSAPVDRTAVDEALASAATEEDLLDLLEQSLEAQADRGAVVVVDDAHLINRLVLGKLQELLNRSSTAHGLTIVLIGEPALQSTLQRPEFKSLNRRVVTRCRLDAPAPSRAAVPLSSPRVRVGGIVRSRRLALQLGLVIFVSVVAWRGVGVARRALETSSPPPATAPTKPTPEMPASAAPAAPQATAPRAVAVEEIDAKLDALHRGTDRQAFPLARRGDVDGLLQLRADTQRKYAEIGADRPDFLAALLAELDVQLERARGVQRSSSRP